MLKMKRLAHQKYNEACVRLLQTSTLDPLLFYGVPLVIAGAVNDDLQVTAIDGQVYSRPVFQKTFKNPHNPAE